jgi:uncharacterized protein YjgD (DUF1641 family)
VRDVTEGGALTDEALYGMNEAQNMTKEELLKLMRLLSALEAVGVLREQLPDYLLEDLSEAVAILEREILK